MTPPPATADHPQTGTLSGPRAWQAADLRESDWRHPIDAACRSEFAAIVSRLRSGYEMTGSAMGPATRPAIAALEDVFADSSLQFQFAMTAGQFQYVNNKAIGHSRTEFEDFDDPDARRHLVRLWMRSQRNLAYSG